MVVPTTSVHLRPRNGTNSNSNNSSKKKKKKNDDSNVVIGRSRAGQATSWALPKYKTIVDVGCIVDTFMPKTIFLTHTHHDHVQSLMDIINRLPRKPPQLPPSASTTIDGNDVSNDEEEGEKKKNPKKQQQQHQQQPSLRIYVPAEAEPFVRNYIEAAQMMYDCGIDDGANSDDEDDDDSDNDSKSNSAVQDEQLNGHQHNDVNNHNSDTNDRRKFRLATHQSASQQSSANIFQKVQVCPVRPGEIVDVGQQGQQNHLRVEVLRMTHRIPCVGYSFIQLKRQLKSEYVGLSGPEIGELRRSVGVDMFEVVEEPLICIMGDTTSQVFEDYPHIPARHSYVVVECSFLESTDRARAEKTKHMLWDDLEPHVRNNPDTMFLLTHFSLRYSTLSVRRRFREIQKTYNNVHPMLLDDEIQDQWTKANNKNRKGGIDSKREEEEEEEVPTCLCRMCVSSSKTSLPAVDTGTPLELSG